MRIIAVIPARMGSTRFPGKPLALINGRPMIEHVYRGTAGCAQLDDVCIATCDAAVARAGEAFGAHVVMTGDHHVRASDRVAEACAQDSAAIVVMVQGDEPMVQARMIDDAVTPLLKDASIQCVNLMARIGTRGELSDPNTIKVVTDAKGRALYFSRSPIPSPALQTRDAGAWFKQVCVIAFRRSALSGFATLAPGPLEQAESIDMLRFLEHGIPVQMALTRVATHAVDTPADIAIVAARLGGADHRQVRP